MKDVEMIGKQIKATIIARKYSTLIKEGTSQVYLVADLTS